MVNVFKVKKYGAFLFAAFIPTVLFFVALISWGFLYSLLFFFSGAILSMVLAPRLIRHPMLEMLEGKGLLVLKLDSTGVIRPFIAKVAEPFLELNYGHGRKKFSVFDRNTVNYLTAPTTAYVDEENVQKEIVDRKTHEITGYETEKKIILSLPKSDYVKSLFSWGAFPVLIWNEILGEFYTKEMLATAETETFVQHLVLYLNRKVDELSNNIRDFARYIVEQSRPKASFLQSKLFWIIIIAVILIMVLLFAPQIISTISRATVPSLPNTPITPR